MGYAVGLGYYLMAPSLFIRNLFTTFLDEVYFEKKSKMDIPAVTVVSTPRNLVIFTNKVYELLGLLMIYAYSNRLIKMDMMDKGDLEIIEENDEGTEEDEVY